ncbi:MAG: cytochrome c3 family protein [Coriobacteriales bacterium]|jgi:hypothetical protein|nr:cytochrome c3 family protein [Coriobacteriales bacterium]
MSEKNTKSTAASKTESDKLANKVTSDKACETASDATCDESIVATATKAKPRKKRSTLFATLGVLVVLVIAIGASVWVWHEDPSFCGAICHSPMDSYVEGYYATPGEPTTDKFGNKVSDASAMLAVSHAAEDIGCLECHVPSIPQQMGEFALWVSGDYYMPLEEKNLHELLVDSGQKSSEKGNEFCLVEGCHTDSSGNALDEDNLKSLLWGNPRYSYRNPHNPPMDSTHNRLDYSCSDCHKSHRASVNACTQCHAELKELLPSGWQTYLQGAIDYKQINEVK